LLVTLAISLADAFADFDFDFDALLLFTTHHQLIGQLAKGWSWPALNRIVESSRGI
jgi:hypothetical protein